MDKLWQAISEYFKAQKEYNKAYEEYDGYSWDWAGSYVIEKLNKAKEKAEAAINEIVDNRIKENKK